MTGSVATTTPDLRRLHSAMLAGWCGIAMFLLVRLTPPGAWFGIIFATAPIALFGRSASRSLVLAVAGLCPAFFVGYTLVRSGVAEHWAGGAVIALGVACIVAACGRVAFATDTNDRRDRVQTAAVVAFFPCFTYLALSLLARAAHSTPLTYDHLLAVIDARLAMNRFQPSVLAGQVIANRPQLRAAVTVFYDAFPIAFTLAAVVRYRQFGPEAERASYLTAAVASTLANLGYWLVPASGPQFLWHPFPQAAPSLATVLALSTTAAPLSADYVRNALPSMHFCGALIVGAMLWNTGTLARVAGVGFVALTAFATLATGQHYLIDLIAAVPLFVVSSGLAAAIVRSLIVHERQTKKAKR